MRGSTMAGAGPGRPVPGFFPLHWVRLKAAEL